MTSAVASAVREAAAADGLDAVVASGSEYTGFEGAVRYLSGFRILHRYAYVVLPVEVSARCRKGESLLRAVRNWQGLTQAEVAEKAGLTQGYLSDLESGKREGTAQTLRMIAKALEIDPVMLVDPRE